MATSAPHYRAVNEFDPITLDQSVAHFERKLRLEVDPAEVHFDREKGIHNFVVLDTRSTADFEREHIARARNIPHRADEYGDDRDLSRDFETSTGK